MGCNSTLHWIKEKALLIFSRVKVSVSMHNRLTFVFPYYVYSRYCVDNSSFIFHIFICYMSQLTILFYFLFAEMNRHHFALFVRNCRLILLLRREHSDGDLNTFRPAEWRWKVPQVRNKKTINLRWKA